MRVPRLMLFMAIPLPQDCQPSPAPKLTSVKGRPETQTGHWPPPLLQQVSGGQSVDHLHSWHTGGRRTNVSLAGPKLWLAEMRRFCCALQPDVSMIVRLDGARELVFILHDWKHCTGREVPLESCGPTRNWAQLVWPRELR